MRSLNLIEIINMLSTCCYHLSQHLNFPRNCPSSPIMPPNILTILFHCEYQTEDEHLCFIHVYSKYIYSKIQLQYPSQNGNIFKRLFLPMSRPAPSLISLPHFRSSPSPSTMGGCGARWTPSPLHILAFKKVCVERVHHR